MNLIMLILTMTLKKVHYNMEMTRRCDYACRILRSAYNHGDSYVSISEVAEEEDIPYAFARTIQHDLALAGYLKTIRGAHGGLHLAINPADITLFKLMVDLKGSITVSPCAANPDLCAKSGTCAFNKVWIAADHVLKTFFDSITLQDAFDSAHICDVLAPVDDKAEAEIKQTVAKIRS
jgi:Rrf2 family protein